MNWLLSRLAEPSSYAGLSGMLYGADKLFNLHGVPQVAEAVAKGGSVVAGGGSPAMAGVVILTGLLAFFMPEKRA